MTASVIIPPEESNRNARELEQRMRAAEDAEREGPPQRLAGIPSGRRIIEGEKWLRHAVVRLRGLGLSAHEVVLALEYVMGVVERDRNSGTRTI